MSEQRRLQLETELEELKIKRNRSVVRVTPVLPALLMAAGIILTAAGQETLGYSLGAVGFLGMMVSMLVSRILESRARAMEARILEKARELAELRECLSDR